MSGAIWIIGGLIALEGILFIVKPALIRPLINFFNKRLRLYFLALLRIILAIIFFLGATQCQEPWMIISLGLLLLIGGIIVLVMKPETTRSMLSWWLEKPLILIRLLSIVTLLFGAAVIYAAWP